jgi:hypothetical protein
MQQQRNIWGKLARILGIPGAMEQKARLRVQQHSLIASDELRREGDLVVSSNRSLSTSLLGQFFRFVCWPQENSEDQAALLQEKTLQIGDCKATGHWRGLYRPPVVENA